MMNEYKRVENIKRLFNHLIKEEILTADELAEIMIKFMDDSDNCFKIANANLKDVFPTLNG